MRVIFIRKKVVSYNYDLEFKKLKHVNTLYEVVYVVKKDLGLVC